MARKNQPHTPMNSNATPAEQGSTRPTRSGLRPAKPDKITTGTPAARTRSRSRSRTRPTSQSKATSKPKKPNAATSAKTQQNVAVPASSDRRRSARLLDKPDDTTQVLESVQQPKPSRRSEVELLLDSSFTPVVARRLRPRGADLQEASLDNNLAASASTPVSSNNITPRAMSSFGTEKVVRFVDTENGYLRPTFDTPEHPFASHDPFTIRDNFAISERLLAIDKRGQPVKFGLFIHRLLSRLEYGSVVVLSRTYYCACLVFRWIKEPRNAAKVAIFLVPAVILLVLSIISMDQFCRFAYRIGLCKNVFSWLCVLPKNRGECWVGIETPLGFTFGGRTYLIHV